MLDGYKKTTVVSDKHAKEIIIKRYETHTRFMRFAERLTGHIVNYFTSTSEQPFESSERPVTHVGLGNAVSSRVRDDKRTKVRPLDFVSEVGRRNVGDPKFDEEHMPVLDIDVPCLLLDSSTTGHHHLIIQKSMSWDDYAKLLMVLGEVGILEDGYVHASIERHGSYIRTPWTKK